MKKNLQLLLLLVIACLAGVGQPFICQMLVLLSINTSYARLCFCIFWPLISETRPTPHPIQYTLSNRRYEALPWPTSKAFLLSKTYEPTPPQCLAGVGQPLICQMLVLQCTNTSCARLLSCIFWPLKSERETLTPITQYIWTSKRSLGLFLDTWESFSKTIWTHPTTHWHSHFQKCQKLLKWEYFERH